MISKPVINDDKKYLLNIVKKNNISEILKFTETENGIEYDNDGMLSLSDNLSGIVNIDIFFHYLKRILIILNNLENFMIFDNDLYINSDDIYISTNDEIFFMMNLDNSQSDFRLFFQSIMNNTRFKIDENSKKLIELNNYLNTGNYSKQGVMNIISIENKCIFEEEISKNNIKQENNKKNYMSFFSELFKKENNKIKKNDKLDDIFKL